MYERERETALAAVREAARLCRAVQSRLANGVLDKQDRSPVTIADFGSQAVVCRTLQEAFPDDPVIGEEDAAMLRSEAGAGLLERVVEAVRGVRPGADASDVCRWIDRGGARSYQDRFWTLDPIDGTKGFLRGEQYAIALALVVNGTVEVAVLGCPNLGPDPLVVSDEGSLYVAVRGAGAERLSLRGEGGAERIGVAARHALAEARYCESVESAHSDQQEAAGVARRLGLTAPPIRVDSQVKYALVARGDADLYLRLPRNADYVENIWDHAAGALVVTEAGGCVSDLDGRPLDFGRGSTLAGNRGIVASNPRLHADALAAIAATS